MKKYDYTYYHQELLKLQSLDFDRYKLVTEVDLLMNDLGNGNIGDYTEVNWPWISHLLYGEEHYYGKEGWCHFDLEGELEIFASKIVSKAERVRILTFLRDKCREFLFPYKYTEDECIEKFEKECARLISQSLHPLRPDEVHGKFLNEPQPNLQAIAMGEPKKEYSIMENTIMAAVPDFPSDRNNISKNTLLQVAYDFWDIFKKSVEEYEESGRDDAKKPYMSQSKYVERIYRMIGERANRFLYWNNNPVYQVYFILGCLMGMPNHKRTWWEEKFAEGIGDYLEKTANFKGAKTKIKEVIKNILALNQYTLDFGADDVEKAKDASPDVNAMEFYDDVAPDIQYSMPLVKEDANGDKFIVARPVVVQKDGDSTFSRLINHTNPSRVLTVLHERIDNRKGKDIGVVLAAAVYKYNALTRTPTEKEFRDEFQNILECSWRSISEWLKKVNKVSDLRPDIRDVDLDFD